MDKKTAVITVCLIFAVVGSSFSVDTQKEKFEKGQKMPGHSMMGRGMMEYGMSRDFVEHMVVHKIHFMINKQVDIGLSDEQVSKINNLNHELQKKLIEKNAAIEVIELDIKSGLTEELINKDAVDKLIDKKHAAEAEKDKILVTTYAEINDMLTKKQKDSLMQIWKKQASGPDSCPMCQ